jgi:hypothetical protein
MDNQMSPSKRAEMSKGIHTRQAARKLQLEAAATPAVAAPQVVQPQANAEGQAPRPLDAAGVGEQVARIFSERMAHAESAQARERAAEGAQKALNRVLEIQCDFLGSELEVEAYARGAVSALRFLFRVAQVVENYPPVCADAILGLVNIFPKPSKAFNWALDAPIVADAKEDFSRIVDDFTTRFFDITHATEAERALAKLKMKQSETPMQLLERMVCLESLLAHDTSLDMSLERFMRALPADLSTRLESDGVDKVEKLAKKAESKWALLNAEKSSQPSAKKVSAVSVGEGSTSAADYNQKPRAPFRSGVAPAGSASRAKVCFVCRKEGHFAAECKLKSCGKCSQLGHLAWECPNDTKPGSSSSPSFVSIASLSTSASVHRIFVDVGLGGRSRRALVDIGAECTVAPEAAIQGIKFRRMPPRWSAIQTPNGSRSEVLYSARTSLQFGRAGTRVEVQIVAALDEDLIIGCDALASLGLLEKFRNCVRDMGARLASARAVDSTGDYRGEGEEYIAKVDLSHLDGFPEQRDRLKAALLKYRGVFLAKGRLPGPARVPPAAIVTTGPPVIVAARPWGYDTRVALKEHERLLVDEGLSFPVASSEWRSEPLLVWKPDGSTRYTGDYKAANGSLASEAFPMPNIREEAERLLGSELGGSVRGGANMRFSKYDLANGFWQIPTTPESWPASTLRSTDGLIRSTRLQMGHSAAPGVFNHRLRTCLVQKVGGPTRARMGQYLDDVATSADGITVEEAIRKEVDNVIEVLRVAEEMHFSLRLSKCLFVAPSIEFCGYELSGGKRKLGMSRVAGILNFGVVESKAQLRSLTGMLGYWRGEVTRIDLLLLPLYDAMKAPGKLVVTKELTAAMEAAKAACCAATAKRPFIPTLPSTIRVDGSRNGFGAVLEQEGHVVALTSRVKSKAELNYGAFRYRVVRNSFRLGSVRTLHIRPD